MKILIVNTNDIQGGAARAANRLHKSLLSFDIDSQMLVKNKYTDDHTVLGYYSKKISKYFNLFCSIMDNYLLRIYKNRSKTLFSPSRFIYNDIVKIINEINADIVHLHWICGSMLRIEDIAKIKAPIVWSLHDQWAFTGGCHYDEECGRFRESCGKCKVLRSTKDNDLSRRVWNRKNKTYSKIKHMTIVALSKWLEKEAIESSLFKPFEIVNLPNPINTNVFKPIDKVIAKQLLNLPINKKLILFGAMGATSDNRKGFAFLSDALLKLKNNNIEFVVFGSSEPRDVQNFGFKTHYLGNLQDDVSLSILYNAVDLMIAPSLQENLSNVIMESLSCGTPAVAFNIGGNSDMIEHQISGYLAKPYDTTDLANGIEWVLNSSNYKELCVNAREKVLREFDSEIVAKKYIDLYNRILK